MTKKAIQAAIEFLQNDEARDLLGLHKIRVDGQLRTRGELADLLHAALAQNEGPENSGQSNTSLTFGQAIEAVKRGRRAARSGWNGKGLFIYLNKGSVDGARLGYRPGEQPLPDHQSTLDGVRLGLFETGDTGTLTRLPNINMHSATGSTVTGWLASQTDLLAEDWTILD